MKIVRYGNRKYLRPRHVGGGVDPKHSASCGRVNWWNWQLCGERCEHIYMKSERADKRNWRKKGRKELRHLLYRNVHCRRMNAWWTGRNHSKRPHLPPAHHPHPPSHIHCFIPGSKLTFSTNLFHHSLLAPTWTVFSDYTGLTLLNGFSFLVNFCFVLGRAVDQAGLTASFRVHVNII